MRETIDSIKILTDIAQDCELCINKAKSNILIYNSKEQPDHIEDIPVTNKMNYFGVTVQNKKDCFKLHKEECLNKARHRSNLMPAVIAKRCNKILIGKNILEKCCSTFHYAWYRNCLFHKKKDLRLTNSRK